jgi:hypothetical protein
MSSRSALTGSRSTERSDGSDPVCGARILQRLRTGGESLPRAQWRFAYTIATASPVGPLLRGKRMEVVGALRSYAGL